ncbi:MAG: transposase family protein [Gammaproteobacteria bacterium]|nr:transposase family protein [Gammaproteobacteria bacterium]
MLAKLLNRLEVAHTFTPAYNPQSNNVERFHRTLRDHYQIWTATKEMNCLELAYNSKVNEATGLTPFLVFLGREAKLPADMVLPNKNEIFEHRGDSVAHCLDKMDKIYLKRKEEIRMRYSNLVYLVWYLSSRNVPHKPLKVTKSWTGPWEIEKRVAYGQILTKSWRS